jgi:hypothetical protein
MQIEIEDGTLFINGKSFCAVQCDLVGGAYKLAILSRNGNSFVHVIGAGVNFTDGEGEDAGILVGEYIIDSCAINSRSTLAKLYRKVLDAIEDGQVITMEVV